MTEDNDKDWWVYNYIREQIPVDLPLPFLVLADTCFEPLKLPQQCKLNEMELLNKFQSITLVS